MTLNKDELQELCEMAADLGVERVLALPLEVANARIHTALWKRLLEAEKKAGYCACPDAPEA